MERNNQDIKSQSGTELNQNQMIEQDLLSQTSEFLVEDAKDGYDDKALIDLHKLYGNKWKKISLHFLNRTDSFIKNHFYSILRRSLRKVNSYIKLRNKVDNTKHKPLKLNFIFKLTNLAQSERNIISNKKYYTGLLYQFLDLKNYTRVFQKNNLKQTFQQTQILQEFKNETIQDLIHELRSIEQFFLDHNLNKKGKSKKKCPKKIFLKKDAIQQSLNMRDGCEIHTHPSIETEQNSQHLDFQTIKWQPQKKYELINFDFQDQFMKDHNSILPLDQIFDPILFN